MRSRILKLTLAGLLGAAVSGQVAWAQISSSPSQAVAAPLTEDQKSRLQEIRKSQADQIKAIRDDATLTQGQKRQEIRKINRNAQPQIKSVLSPEQYRRFRHRMHERRADRRGGQRGPGQGQRQRRPH